MLDLQNHSHYNIIKPFAWQRKELLPLHRDSWGGA